ncbi:hypothetical protein CHU98_g3170 [Xylaria longipes]|nr:hypothetical protein CHU98_g3170 [Xylaria longipes]
MRNPGRSQPIIHTAASANMPHRVCVFVRLALMASIPSYDPPHSRKARQNRSFRTDLVPSLGENETTES